VTLRRALDRAISSAAASRAALVRATRQRNEELLALAGAVAHELKNPLAAIRGLASLQAKRLEKGTKEAEQMGVLVDEVKRMGTILDEFLNFSRPADDLAKRSVDPSDVVAKVVSIHEALAAERAVELDAAIATRVPITCDPRKLEQVLVNLVQNAIDASDAGTRVTVRTACDAGEHVFRVEDRGAGLEDAVRGRLFTAGATTKVAGSGLGLTIARAIVEQHGGTLSLREREGGGCVAEVRLPSSATADDVQ
jgi:signal transduction histidine kinase